MRILLLLFTLVCYSKAQTLFTETFSDFHPDTTVANAELMYILDGTNFPPAYGDKSDGNDLSTLLTQTTAGQVAGSILYEGGFSEDFQGSGTLTIVNNAILNETGSKSIACIFNMDALSGVQYIMTHDPGSATRDWFLQTNNAQLRFQIFGASTAYRPSSSKAIDTWYIVVGVYDTVGTASINLYVNGVASAEAVSGTIPEAANALNERMNISGISAGTSDIDGQVTFAAVYAGAIPLKQIKELGYLASGWLSGGGAVTRSNFGFHQGITGSGLTIRTKAGGSGGGFTYTPTLTASQATYTKRFAVPFSFDTDSLLLETDTDSVWKGITDYDLAGVDSLQVQFDAWETGGVVYIDDITISGYTIPPATATSKFKGNDYFDRFKGW